MKVYLKLLFATFFTFFSFLLANRISDLVNTVVIFAEPKMYIIPIVLYLLIAVFYTISLALWNKSFEYYFVAIPLGLGIFGAFATINISWALLFLLISSLLFITYTNVAWQNYQKIIKFDSRYIFKASIKGIFFVYALYAALIVLLNQNILKDFDFSEKVATYAEDIAASYIEKQPALATMRAANLLNLDIKAQVREQVDSYLESYKDIIVPILSLLTFLSFSFLSAVVYTLYALIIGGIMAILKALNLISTKVVMVEKEILSIELKEA